MKSYPITLTPAQIAWLRRERDLTDIDLPTGGCQGRTQYISRSGRPMVVVGTWAQIRRTLRRHGYQISRPSAPGSEERGWRRGPRHY